MKLCACPIFSISTHPGLELRRSMEEASEAWSRLDEQVLLSEAPNEYEGPVSAEWAEWAREWCVWRDLGRLAKRPSAIILNSRHEHKNTLESMLRQVLCNNPL